VTPVRSFVAAATAMIGSERRLAAIAGSVIGSNLVTAALGMVFWILAARGLARASLGTSMTATTAMMFLGVFGCMGLGQLLISELPRTPTDQRRELFVVACGVATLLGAVLGSVFGAVAAATGEVWVPLRAPGAAWWWFVLGAGLTSLSIVLDSAMLVVGNPTMQVWRNTVASGWKLAVLAVALPLSAVDITLSLAAWTTGLFVGNVMALRAAIRWMPGRRTVPLRRATAVIRRQALFAVSHQGLNLALTVSWVMMPLLISWVVTPEENGVFGTVRLPAAQIAVLPYALAMALFAASAGSGLDPERSRRVLLTSLGASLVLYLLTYVAAYYLLWLFGRGYAVEGVSYLRVMALGGPLLVFKDQFIAHSRVQRKVGSIIPLVLVSAVLEVSLAVAGALRWHLMGAICGWLLALLVQAVYIAPKLTWRKTPQPAMG
jgi:O-antigen/teichoic acid export membrane protein